MGINSVPGLATSLAEATRRSVTPVDVLGLATRMVIRSSASKMPAAQSTEERKVLKVGSALPDPPFEFSGNDGPAGFDVDLMRRIAAKLGHDWRLVPYKGADFNGIFAGLDDG